MTTVLVWVLTMNTLTFFPGYFASYEDCRAANKLTGFNGACHEHRVIKTWP